MSPPRTSKLSRYLAIALLALGLSSCGINVAPTLDQQAKAAWAEVQNQYQRRNDLIPNLVETVKGYAKQEQTVLTDVVNARAKATSVTVDASTLNDPAKFQQYQDAQNGLSQSLGRLLMVQENYPDLKSNQNFLALQSQLEGTENRITIARRDYNTAVQALNTRLVTIPGKWIAGLFNPTIKPMPLFTATAGADKPVQVHF